MNKDCNSELLSDEFDWTEKKATEVKSKINAVIWENAPRRLSLDEAEGLAMKIFEMIQSGKSNP